MEPNNITDSEITRYFGEKKAAKAHIMAEQEIYKNKMLGGLGEEIENYLNNPPVPKKQKNNIITKLKKWIRF